MESASDKLLKDAAKALNDNCDPTVLLSETEQQLEYEKRGITNQLVLLNHTVALGYMGEYSKAFEILSSFDADKYKFISPYRAYIKMIHSNNMADTCDELGDFESASAWHKKTLDAAKKLGMLKSSEIILAKASEALRKKDYGAVLKALEGFKEKNMLEKICASMVYAKAYIGLGEIEKAKEKLSFIIENGNKLYDITTGSVIADPAFIRLVSITDEKTINIKSIPTPDFIWDTDDCKKYLSDMFDRMIVNIITDMRDDTERAMRKLGIKNKGITKKCLRIAGNFICKVKVGTLARLLFIKCDKSIKNMRVLDYATELVRGVFEGNQTFVEGTPKGDVWLNLLKRINFILKRINLKGWDGKKADLYDLLKNTAGNYDIDDYNATLTIK